MLREPGAGRGLQSISPLGIETGGRETLRKISAKRATTAVMALAVVAALGVTQSAAATTQTAAAPTKTATPIKHLVVIYPENISFDHYFGTYPNAANPPVEPAFHAAPRTPSVNGLSQALLTSNPNTANPQRLDVTKHSPATRTTVTAPSRRHSTTG
jgi:phospholipase C